MDVLGILALHRATALAAGLAFVLLFAVSWLRVRAGHTPALRPLPGCDLLRQAVGDHAEDGRTLHISTGGAGIGDAFTLETLAGVAVLQELAQPAATATTRLIISTGSPVVLPMAQQMLAHAYEEAGYPEEYDPTLVRFLASDRNAYAVAAADLVRQEQAATSALLGNFGDEYLLLGEPCAQASVTQVVGTAQPLTLPFMVATGNHVLLGEELFAAGAYLSRKATQVASLMAQDYMRLLVVAVILIGVLQETLRLR